MSSPLYLPPGDEGFPPEGVARLPTMNSKTAPHDSTDDDTIDIAEPTPVGSLELPCPDCDAELEVTTDEAWAPDYEVECPDCGFTDVYVAG